MIKRKQDNICIILEKDTTSREKLETLRRYADKRGVYHEDLIHNGRPDQTNIKELLSRCREREVQQSIFHSSRAARFSAHTAMISALVALLALLMQFFINH